jgi:hypothetical protein
MELWRAGGRSANEPPPGVSQRVAGGPGGGNHTVGNSRLRTSSGRGTTWTDTMETTDAHDSPPHAPYDPLDPFSPPIRRQTAG